jgi:hypothetical protein
MSTCKRYVNKLMVINNIDSLDTLFDSGCLIFTDEVSYEIYDSYKKGIKPIEIRNRYYGSIGR